MRAEGRGPLLAPSPAMAKLTYRSLGINADTTGRSEVARRSSSRFPMFVTVALFRKWAVSVRTRRRIRPVYRHHRQFGGRPRVVLDDLGVRAAHLYRRRPIPAMIGAGRDQLQTPHFGGGSSGASQGTPNGTSKKDSVVSVIACRSMRRLLSVAAWHSSFYADPATRETFTWSRATATIRVRHGGAHSAISAASKTARTRSPKHSCIGKR
jgi:hypothetical protein